MQSETLTNDNSATNSKQIEENLYDQRKKYISGTHFGKSGGWGGGDKLLVPSNFMINLYSFQAKDLPSY